MLKSGHTPLIRARKLEKLFPVGEIYLKLEGQNPSGHKLDRIGEVLVKNAVAHKYQKIIAYGSYNYIISILYFAKENDLQVIVPYFKHESWKVKKFKDEDLRDLRAHKINKTEVLYQLSEEENAFLAAEGYMNTHISQMAMENLFEEMFYKLKKNVTSVFLQLGYGYTLTGGYNVFLKEWMEGNIEHFPTVKCGTWEKGNSLYKKYLEQNTKRLSETPNSNDINDPQYLMDDKLLNDTLKAVYESNGSIIPIIDEELKIAAKLLRKQENVKVSYSEAYPLAAFIKSYEDGNLKEGKHVIVLNEGKTQVQVKRLESFDSIGKEELVTMTRDYLAQYHDSTMETREAIENAMDRGFILLAKKEDMIQGVCIVVHMGFDVFIPTYHLAYIGTSKNLKGRGVGSELIQRAIDLTDGTISLHVDLDNKNAKKVYEKYGFKHVYNRMIYYGLD